MATIRAIRPFAEDLNYLTWVVLKAHTNNCAGGVTLLSADPRDRPQIDFCYFQDGTPDHEQDIDSVVGRHQVCAQDDRPPESTGSDRRRRISGR